MIATVEQDILNIIENFKKYVNPSFTANSQDLMKIRRIIQDWKLGKETENGNTLYTFIDYEGLKRHGVKNFSFSLEEYSEWQNETIEILKQDYINRRKDTWLSMRDN